jgi:predicted nuclease of predicted toxin-antitoxin system
MKLLLDENLSRRLVPFLQNEFPGSTQVALVGLERADDRTIWKHAKENAYTIVTRDADFEELSAIHGAPPHVIWIRTPNQGISAVLKLLLKHRAVLFETLQEKDIACVELGPQGVDQ